MLNVETQSLVQRIEKGDRKAEKILFQTYGSRIAWKVSSSLGRANDDWKDIVGEVQLALISSLRAGKFDSTRGGSLGSYVFGITMNKIRDYYKYQKRRSRISSNLNPAASVDAVALFEIEREETRRDLRRLLMGLKAKYREILLLRYFEDLSIGEISVKLDLPSRRVSERLHYAARLLRREYEKSDHFSIFHTWVLIFL